MAKIILKNGPDQGKEFNLGDGTTSIGRDPESVISIGDRSASGLHAEIVPEGLGRYRLRDLGSGLGTFLNGASVTENPLEPGDEIKIGTTLLLFSEEDGQGAASSENSIFAESDPPTDKVIRLALGSDQVEFLRTEERDPRRVRAAHRKLTTLYRISQSLASVRALPELLQRTLELIIKAVRADRGCILVEDETGELVPQAILDPTSSGRRLAVSRTMAQEALRTEQAILTSDAARDSRYEGKESVAVHKIRSAMCAPLKTPTRNLGVVSVHRTRPLSPFVEEDLEFLVVICNQAAVSIENARLFEDVKRANRLLLSAKDEIVRWTRELEVKVEERTGELRRKSKQLERLSVTDGMTGLFNHQHFQKELAKEVKRMLRYREGTREKTFALSMIDLDNLKWLNDTFGHLAGDTILKMVSGVLKNNLRAVDLPARYGGDEFAILLPETTLAGAKSAMDKILVRVQDLNLTFGDLLGKPSRTQIKEVQERLGRPLDLSEMVPITISVGLAVYQRPQSPKDLVARADEALYRAKGSGRNQVLVAGELLPEPGEEG